MVLSALEASWVLPACLAVSGLVFLADAASESGPRKHTVATFALNFLSLPVGALTLLAAGLLALHTGQFGLGAGAGIILGAILAGRSLREVPWTGVASLAVGAATAYFLDEHSPWSLSLVQLLAVTAVVFVVIYVILYLVELPLRLAGLVALPRLLLVPLGLASLVVAGYLAVPGLL